MNYYVYIYLDSSKPGNFNYQNLTFKYQPIYIGKGKNLRYKSHFSNCKNPYFDNKKGYRRIFYRKLRKLLSTGVNPIIEFYKTNIKEKEAFILEIELINKIGRKIDKKGPLYNTSIGGEGVTGSKRLNRNRIYVYNNNGVKIDDVLNIDECSQKYNIKKSFIYKSYLGIRKSPKNGLRFKKENFNNIEIFKPLPPNRKVAVLVYDEQNNFINEFISVSECSRNLKIGRTSIDNNLAGRSKFCRDKSKKKFKFKYKKK